jgi:hypothetical protein
LRRNDEEYPKIDQFTKWYHDIDEWTKDEFGDVADAVERNTSIRSLSVMVTAEITEETAVKIASIGRIFGKLNEFQIDSDREGGSKVAPAVVDAILSGMARSKAPVEKVSLIARGGKKAISDFMKNFPGITEFRLGSDFWPIWLSEEFALTIAAFFTRTQPPKLTLLELAYKGHDHGAAQILMCSTISCPELKNLKVSLCETNDSTSVLKVLGIACASSSLKRLELSWFGSKTLDLAPMFVSCPGPWHVTDFICDVCRFPKAETMAESQALLSVSSFTAMRCDFEDTIEHTLQQLPSLKKVDLGYYLSNNEVQSLASFIASSSTIDYTSLRLENTSERSFPAITTLLQNGTGHLKMNLAELSFSNMNFVLHGLQCSGSSLTSVALSYWDGVGPKEIDYACFLHALASNETLERFEFDICDMENLGELGQALTTLLCLNRKLKVLKLVNVPLDSCAAIVRGSALGLRENGSLQELHIECEDIESGDDESDDDEGRALLLSEDILRLLLELLTGTDECPGNRVFQTLNCDVSFPSIGPNAAVAAEVQFLMKQNRLGRRSVLAVPQLHAGVWPHLLRKAAADPSAHDVMFLHVKASADRLQEYGPAPPLGTRRGEGIEATAAGVKPRYICRGNGSLSSSALAEQASHGSHASSGGIARPLANCDAGSYSCIGCRNI